MLWALNIFVTRSRNSWLSPATLPSATVYVRISKTRLFPCARTAVKNGTAFPANSPARKMPAQAVTVYLFIDMIPPERSVVSDVYADPQKVAGGAPAGLHRPTTASPVKTRFFMRQPSFVFT